MLKSDIIKNIKKHFADLTADEIKFIVTLVFSEITKTLKDKNRVELRGIGSFCVRKRNSQKARNPKTGEKLFLNERHVVYFRSGKKLKEILKAKV